jgi:hypothetical protein
MRDMNTEDGMSSERIRESRVAPRIAKGNDAMRSFGRWDVRYTWNGDTWVGNEED